MLKQISVLVIMPTLRVLNYHVTIHYEFDKAPVLPYAPGDIGVHSRDGEIEDLLKLIVSRLFFDICRLYSDCNVRLLVLIIEIFGSIIQSLLEN